jgi:hypothetical protein
MSTQKNVLEQKVLTESVIVQLHLTKAELEAYKMIAEAEHITLEQAINRTLHTSAQADLDSAGIGEGGRGKELWVEIGLSHEKIWQEQTTLENTRHLGKKVKVPTILEVDKATYEEFRKTYDEISFVDMASSVMVDTMEQFTDNPGDDTYWLPAQRERERQAKEAKQTEAKPEILFTLKGEQARRLIENRDILSSTHYPDKDIVEFYLTE